MYHSDNGVDKFLESILPASGYAADIGANDGVRLSNSLLFEDNGWTVLCVEPNPYLSDSLSKNRKLCRFCACGSEERDLEFTAIGQYPFISGSGFNTQTARSLFALTPIETKFMVHVRTLDSLLDEVKFPRLDYLTIDVEGHEFDVLKGCSLNKWKPNIIVAESWTPNIPFADHLNSFGYKQIANFQFDYIYERH